MLVIGIDPGASGAIARIEKLNGSQPEIQVYPIPALDRGVDVAKLIELSRDLGPIDTHVWIESNTGRQHDMPDRAFRFGLNTGQIHATMTCMGFAIHWLTPATWCGRFGVRGKVDDFNCRERAAKLLTIYPQAEDLITGPRGGILDGPLDAIWIAHYGRVCLDGGETPRIISRWAPRPARGLDTLDPFVAPRRRQRTKPWELERKDTKLA